VLVQGLGERRDRVTQHALTTLQTMHEVAKRLVPQIVRGASEHTCEGLPSHRTGRHARNRPPFPSSTARRKHR
jgi:hypothetical protein